MRKYDIAGTKLKQLTTDLDNTMEIYKPSLDLWKEKIEANLEMPMSEHLFHAFFNTLVTLGAKDMGKEGQAKQNMAIRGFQKIGRALGKGLKKEIPAIEQFSGMAGGSSEGGIGGIESFIGPMFGIDIPPGTLNALQGMGGQQAAPKDKGSDDIWGRK